MEHQIRVEKSFRYELIHAEHSPRKVIYVLHGYGQLAKFFIRKFLTVPTDYLIVAPEGMHRFYLQGSSGRVGASWMTKEARAADISDTINYLNQLDKEIARCFTIQERHLIGFSQGGAAAARWYELGEVSFESVSLWGCVFPPDLTSTKFHSSLKKAFFLIGDQDEFFKSPQADLFEVYKEMGFRIFPYTGGHDIIEETLTELLRKIET